MEMYEIVIGITVGEYEHSESLYYFGSELDAERYADSYMSGIWGEGTTIWDEYENSYWSKDGERAASLLSIRPYDAIFAMTEKGLLTYKLEFTLR